MKCSIVGIVALLVACGGAAEEGWPEPVQTESPTEAPESPVVAPVAGGFALPTTAPDRPSAPNPARQPYRPEAEPDPSPEAGPVAPDPAPGPSHTIDPEPTPEPEPIIEEPSPEPLAAADGAECFADDACASGNCWPVYHVGDDGWAREGYCAPGPVIHFCVWVGGDICVPPSTY